MYKKSQTVCLNILPLVLAFTEEFINELNLSKLYSNKRNTLANVIMEHRTNSINMTVDELTFGTGVLHLIQINHEPDATIFQFIILTFVYSSTRFRRFPTHHQELNDCSGSLWFYLRIVVIFVLCSWSGRHHSIILKENSTRCKSVSKCYYSLF